MLKHKQNTIHRLQNQKQNLKLIQDIKKHHLLKISKIPYRQSYLKTTLKILNLPSFHCLLINLIELESFLSLDCFLYLVLPKFSIEFHAYVR